MLANQNDAQDFFLGEALERVVGEPDHQLEVCKEGAREERCEMRVQGGRGWCIICGRATWR